MEFSDLLTQGGLAAAVVLLVGLVKRTAPAFDSQRWGPLLATGFGIVLALAANAAAVADIQMSVAEAVFLGAISGLAASGLYDAGKGITSA